jgi:hypothetical protein
MEGRCDIRPSRPKVGLAGPTPLADRPGPSAFPKNIFTTGQSKSVRGVSNVGKAVECLNLAAQPSCMAGRPKHRLTPPINTPVLNLEESAKKERFIFL